MNKLIAAVLFLFCVVTVSIAQEEESQNYITKGQWLLGGTMALYTSDKFVTPEFSISPNAGYFIGNRWAMGVALRYSIYDGSFENPYTGEEINMTYSNFSATPFARYYFGIGKLAPFAEAGYAMNWRYANGEKTSDDSAYKIGAGLNYFVSPSLAVEGKLSYTRYTDDNNINPLGLGIGLQFFLSRNENVSAKEVSSSFLERGTWMIGGTINLTISDMEHSDDLYQQHIINPKAGYFLTNKLAAGLSAYYSLTNYSYSHNQNFSVGPFARYYFATKKIAPFAEVGFGASKYVVEFYNGTEWQNASDEIFSYQAAVGFNYFLTDFVALETKINYFKSDNADQGSLTLNAGLNFFLPRKK